MSLQHSSEIKRVEVLPSFGEFNNVIKRVVLEITFTDPELAHPVESKSMMVALLSTDDMSNFIELEDKYGLMYNIRDSKLAIEKAVEFLRKEGIAKATKRGEREACEGIIKVGETSRTRIDKRNH